MCTVVLLTRPVYGEQKIKNKWKWVATLMCEIKRQLKSNKCFMQDKKYHDMSQTSQCIGSFKKTKNNEQWIAQTKSKTIHHFQYVSIHTIALIFFLWKFPITETAPQGGEGEVPACSLQAWLLLGRRSQGRLDCSLAPAHLLLLLMQLQGHLLTSKMIPIERTQVLFPKGSQNQVVQVWRVNFSQPCACTLCPRAAAQLCKDTSWQLWRRKAISAEKAMVLLHNYAGLLL